ncbi:MAG: hypothetical protein WCT10_02455 [Patescibacteria group bacterium]|jgi:hypothetical protein
MTFKRWFLFLIAAAFLCFYGILAVVGLQMKQLEKNLDAISKQIDLLDSSISAGMSDLDSLNGFTLNRNQLDLIEGLSPAEITGSSSNHIVLPVDQRLMNVVWLCEDQKPCEPWFLLRTMQLNAVAKNYLVWSPDLGVKYFISENRDSGYWRTENIGVHRLPIEQRLVSVSWICPPDAPCELYPVTRHMERGEQARGYTFTDGHRAFYIWETE